MGGHETRLNPKAVSRTRASVAIKGLEIENKGNKAKRQSGAKKRTRRRLCMSAAVEGSCVGASWLWRAGCRRTRVWLRDRRGQCVTGGLSGSLGRGGVKLNISTSEKVAESSELKPTRAGGQPKGRASSAVAECEGGGCGGVREGASGFRVALCAARNRRHAQRAGGRR